MNDAATIYHSASLRPPHAGEAVPSVGTEETAAVADDAFWQHMSLGLRRGNGGAGGMAVVWLRNDIRVLDNEALARAWAAFGAVLPVCYVDPRVLAGRTHCFGFPKTGGFIVGKQKALEEGGKLYGKTIYVFGADADSFGSPSTVLLDLHLAGL